MERSVPETQLFTNQSLMKLVGPLIVEQLLAVAIGMADTVMVASVGEHAVSAISLVDAINFLIIQVFSALATGGAVVAAQYLGSRDRKGAIHTAKQLTYSVTGIAVVLCALTMAFNAPLLRWIYGALEGRVMAGAQTYLYLSAASYPFLALYNSGAALFRSMGNSKVSMVISLVVNGVNVAGNAILIYGFGMGVAGAGIASLASRILAAVVVTLLLCHKNNPIFLDRPFQFEFRPGTIRRILKVGVPNGLENGIFQVGKLIVAGVVSTFGTATIAANAICSTISSFVCIPGTAIGLALITVVGQCMGAGRPQEAARNVKKLMCGTYALIALLNLLLFVLAEPVARLFNLSEEAVGISVRILQSYALFSAVIWPAAFPFPNALRAAGDAKFTMWVSVISMFVFRVGLCYLLTGPLNMGLMGVWLAMYVDWIGRAACFVPRFLSGKWKRHSVI